MRGSEKGRTNSLQIAFRRSQGKVSHTNFKYQLSSEYLQV